jgi:uncharacterized protein YbjT (DUF2867 family)
MTEIVVFGASGRTGQLIVQTLLERGHAVTAAVRNPGAFSDLVVRMPGAANLRVAKVDVDDPASLEAAGEGKSVAISTIGTGRKPNGLYSRGTGNIVAALTASGTSRFICVSSGGVYRDDPNLGFVFAKIIAPLFMHELYFDMARMEDLVVASGLDWTLVRPAYLTDKPARGTFRVQDGSNPKGGWQVARDDLADFVVAQVSSTDWIRKRPTITW